MMGSISLFLFSVWLPWFYHLDQKERTSVSFGSWIPVLWVIIYGSRPVTEWFARPLDGPIQVSAYDEGNPTEAVVSLLLIVSALMILARRRISVSWFLGNNVWLVVFYLFWLMSASWSDYPLITLKRLVKDLGNVVMVLVVLSDKDSIMAMKAVLSRVAYLCVPLSVLLIRYYPDFGRAYIGYNKSEVMWVGVATHKNTLGVLAFTGALFLLWDLLDYWRSTARRTSQFLLVSRIVVLLMSWYLLLISNSATSLVCAAVGSVLLVVFGLQSLNRSPWVIEAVGLGSVLLFVALDSSLGLKELLIVDVLGRDLTLTTRTDVWPILIAFQDNPLLGAGFNTFWSGQRLARLHEEVATIVQAHNGYLETYLNGGFVGVGLLLALLSSMYLRIRKKLVISQPGSSMRLIVLISAIIYNNSEASFNKVGIMWFVTLYALMEYRTQFHPQTASIRKPLHRAVLTERPA